MPNSRFSVPRIPRRSSRERCWRERFRSYVASAKMGTVQYLLYIGSGISVGDSIPQSGVDCTTVGMVRAGVTHPSRFLPSSIDGHVLV